MGSLADHTCRLKTKVKEIAKPSYAMFTCIHRNISPHVSHGAIAHHVDRLIGEIEPDAPKPNYTIAYVGHVCVV
jgi:hypothetical protein